MPCWHCPCDRPTAPPRLLPTSFVSDELAIERASGMDSVLSGARAATIWLDMSGAELRQGATLLDGELLQSSFCRRDEVGGGAVAETVAGA